MQKISKEKAHEQYVKFKAEHQARSLVSKAIKDGALHKLPCELCGSSENVQAHHDDYTKPLDVTWLCVKCHKQWHTKNQPIRAEYVRRAIHCAFCGNVFEPKERHSMYCCDSCRLEARREVNRRSQKANKYKYTVTYKRLKDGDFPHCAFCGEEFPPCGTVKYCSDDCRHAARLKQKREEYARHKDKYRESNKKYLSNPDNLLAKRIKDAEYKAKKLADNGLADV